MDRNKMLLIFGGAWLSALLLSWFLYTTMSGAKQSKLRPVWAAARDIAAGTKLKKSDLKKVNVQERDVPPATNQVDEKFLLDRALIYPVNANEVLTTSKMAAVGGIEGISSAIPQGMRAVSVSVQDSSSAAGLIQPRAHVDVICSRVGSLSEAVSNMILQDVQVLSVGRVTEVQASSSDPKANAAASAIAAPSGQNRAVTL